MKYFISAGEASGDLHASQLIESLMAVDADASFAFLGGDKMKAASRTEPLIHITEMSVMGFGEVIRSLPRIMGHIKKTKDFIDIWKPDCVILVDYPSFNLKIAKHAHEHGIKVFWYISPKVWVWKEYRVKAMKRYIDRLYCILPFEVDYFRNKHGWDVQYVGNPSAEEVLKKIATEEAVDNSKYLSQHGVEATKPILALLPGSRRKEIVSNLPIMVEVARKHPEFHSVIAGISGVDESLYRQYGGGLSRITDDTFGLLRHSAAALVTSGTATLETALMRVPQVMLYRHSGSKITYKLFRRLLKVKYFSLPNLINNDSTISELVMHFCTPDAVDAELNKIVPDGKDHERQQKDYDRLIKKLGDSHPSDIVARDIYNQCRKVTDKDHSLSQIEK